MLRKTFFITAVLTALLCVGCRQENPTLINSTLQTRNSKNSPTPNSTEHNSMNHGAANQNSANHSGMDHSGMDHSGMKSVPNAANQPYDVQFLDTMIAHHDGAIEMAKGAATKAGNAELKIFAAKILNDQTNEVGEMKKWRSQWYAQTPAAMNMEMAGMADSMKNMNMPKLNQATGKDYDLEFVNQMIPHHEGAIVMAREALTKAEHAEIKTLANKIIQAQEAEIKQMQGFKTQMTK